MIDHPHAIFSCSACGKVAARVELVPPGETTTDPEIPSSATDPSWMRGDWSSMGHRVIL